MKPFAVISDQHFHSWSAFSTVDADGVNSRLRLQINELHRCAWELRRAGGNLIINAGDTFHVRGSLAPSVLNPVMEAHRELIKQGFKIVILAGNHDLESKEANRVSSAITALEDDGCTVVNTFDSPMLDNICVVPWIAKIDELKAQIETVDPKDRAGTDLIIHAPVDDVIVGIPDHGLTSAYLAGLGFRRVFSGHYHHHKDFGNGVYSIGASTHHSWSDVGSKAGFLIVSDTEVKWFKSHAPEFVEITVEIDPDDIALITDGNFVRVKTTTTDEKDIAELRKHLVGCGAKGVVVIANKESSVTPRAGTVMTAGVSLGASVNSYIMSKKFDNETKLAVLCQDILKDVREVA